MSTPLHVLPPPLPSERRRRNWIRALVIGGAIIALMAVLLIVTAGPRRTQRLGRQLQSLADQGKYKEGLALAEKKLPGVKPDGRIFFAMESLHFGVDDLEQTKVYAEKTLETNPGNEMAIRMLLVLCRQFEDYEYGIAAGKKWIAANDHGTDVYKDLALSCDDAGHDTDAFAFAADGFRRKPASTKIAGVYFYYAFEVNGVEPTLREVEKWTAGQEADAYFWAQIGKGLSDAEAWTEALPRLYRALEMGSDDAYVFTEVLDCYRGLKDPAAAEAFFEKFKKSGRFSATHWRLLGSIYYDADDFEKALVAFYKARDLEPSNAISTANILFTLYELERSQDGFNEGRRWLETPGHKPSTTIHRAMGHVSFALNSWIDAERHYRLALEISPVNTQAARDLISTLVELDRADEAVNFGDVWREANRSIKDASFDQSLAKARDRILPPSPR